MSEEDEFGNVIIRKRVARQIEEGVYGADNQDPSDLRLLEPVRRQSLVEVHNDLDAVDPDEFDRIIEREKSHIRKQKSSAQKDKEKKISPEWWRKSKLTIKVSFD